MAEFENIVVGKDSIPSLVLTVLLMLAIPVGIFFFWYKKHKPETSILYLAAGAIGFIVSARVLELGVHYFCILLDNPVSRFINGHAVAYVLYGTVMAAVFEEVGRHIVLQFVMKKNRTRENAVMYGIGHGGIEIIAVILPSMITYLAIAILFSAGNPESALDALKITEETAEATLPAVQAAAAFNYTLMALNVLERSLTMFIHIGLSVIVFYGVFRGRKACLPLALLLHMLVDTFPAMYQKGLMPLWSVEVWILFWTAAILFLAVLFYRRMEEPPSNENSL